MRCSLYSTSSQLCQPGILHPQLWQDRAESSMVQSNTTDTSYNTGRSIPITSAVPRVSLPAWPWAVNHPGDRWDTGHARAPAWMLYSPSLHCCRLECIEHHQATPTCPCGRWHIPDNLHLLDVSKALQGTDASSDTVTSCFPSATSCTWTVAKLSLQPLPAGSTVPSQKHLLLPGNLLPCIILITPF